MQIPKNRANEYKHNSKKKLFFRIFCADKPYKSLVQFLKMKIFRENIFHHELDTIEIFVV